ncbi:MAG: dihydropteroate synthase [Pseudoalteromonas distincta]|jgi:dihydropteroate synthase
MKQNINIKNTLLDLRTPVVMGILNVTPDSFADGGKYTDLDQAVQQAEKMVAEGAAILDVGGYSSRPGASEVSIQEELDRVLPVLEKLKDFTDAFLSIDTFRSKVAAEAVQAGANMVNDISAGEEDDAMLATVARLGVPYIAMHKQGKPKTMQTNPQYTDVVGDVLEYLQKKITQCKVAGIAEVIIDPGFGFGKTTLHNYALLKNLNELTRLNAPILAGISRKSMINKVLETSPEEALNGTTFLHAYALQGGASILRVHDVKEALECVKLYSMLNKGIV